VNINIDSSIHEHGANAVEVVRKHLEGSSSALKKDTPVKVRFNNLLWMKGVIRQADSSLQRGEATSKIASSDSLHVSFSQRGQKVRVARIDSSKALDADSTLFCAVDASGMLPHMPENRTFLATMSPLEDEQLKQRLEHQAHERQMVRNAAAGAGSVEVDDHAQQFLQLRVPTVHGDLTICAQATNGNWVPDQLAENGIRSKKGRERIIAFLKIFSGMSGKDPEQSTEMQEVAREGLLEEDEDQALVKLQKKYGVNQKWRLWQVLQLSQPDDLPKLLLLKQLEDMLPPRTRANFQGETETMISEYTGIAQQRLNVGKAEMHKLLATPLIDGEYFTLSFTVQPVPRAAIITQPVLLVGPAASGKSTFTKQFVFDMAARNLKENTYQQLPITIRVVDLAATVQRAKVPSCALWCLCSAMKYTCSVL
jgi:hypothetical protein